MIDEDEPATRVVPAIENPTVDDDMGDTIPVVPRTSKRQQHFTPRIGIRRDELDADPGDES